VTIVKFIASPNLCAHLTVWCELDQSVVNHGIDEWRRRLSTLTAEIVNITYDCYSQNNNVKMATL